MAYQQKDLSGSAFKNDRKREGKKDPDYTGSMIVQGQPYWLDIWVVNKPGTDGYDSNKKTFLSLGLRPKEERRANAEQARKPSGPPVSRAGREQARRYAPPPPPAAEEPAKEVLDPETGEYTWK